MERAAGVAHHLTLPEHAFGRLAVRRDHHHAHQPGVARLDAGREAAEVVVAGGALGAAAEEQQRVRGAAEQLEEPIVAVVRLVEIDVGDALAGARAALEREPIGGRCVGRTRTTTTMTTTMTTTPPQQPHRDTSTAQ